jgi:uncharacterized membrane protein
MNRMRRLVANTFRAWDLAESQFPEHVFATIGARITESEANHRGDIVFAVEARLALKSVIKGETPRQRAEQVFAELEVWNTEDNAGVLIYVLLAERAIEIVADRGIARYVAPQQWEAICTAAAAAFARGEFQTGAMAAIDSVSNHLHNAVPARPGESRENDLADRPVLL